MSETVPEPHDAGSVFIGRIRTPQTRRGIMAAGDGTSADAIIIEMAGGVNAMTGFEGHKQVRDEAVMAAMTPRREAGHRSQPRHRLRLRPAG